MLFVLAELERLEEDEAFLTMIWLASAAALTFVKLPKSSKSAFRAWISLSSEPPRLAGGVEISAKQVRLRLGRSLGWFEAVLFGRLVGENQAPL